MYEDYLPSKTGRMLEVSKLGVDLKIDFGTKIEELAKKGYSASSMIDELKLKDFYFDEFRFKNSTPEKFFCTLKRALSYAITGFESKNKNFGSYWGIFLDEEEINDWKNKIKYNVSEEVKTKKSYQGLNARGRFSWDEADQNLLFNMMNQFLYVDLDKGTYKNKLLSMHFNDIKHNGEEVRTTRAVKNFIDKQKKAGVLEQKLELVKEFGYVPKQLEEDKYTLAA